MIEGQRKAIERDCHDLARSGNTCVPRGWDRSIVWPAMPTNKGGGKAGAGLLVGHDLTVRM